MVIRHAGAYETVYGHLGSIANNPDIAPPRLWQPEDQIEAGQAIGTSGCSGTGCTGTAYHLHFEVWRSGTKVDPFGWWDSTQPDPWASRGAPSYWLWEASTVTDDREPAFERFPHAGWTDSNSGYQDHAWWTWSTSGQKQDWGIWGLFIPQDGRYSVQAYIPYVSLNERWTTAARYSVVYRNAEGNLVHVSATLNQSEGHNNWITLVREDTRDEWFDFRGDTTVAVILTDVTSDANSIPRPRVVFDAVRAVPGAIDAGLRYLREHQNGDGGWGENGSSTGITALATLAFLNYGFDERDTDVQEAIQFLLEHYEILDFESGRFYGDGPWGEPAYVYDTSLAMLVLIAADHTNDPRQYTDQITQAKNYLLSVQLVDDPNDPDYGGWGYPRDDWADLSNTQWVVMALDAAYKYLNESKPDWREEGTWTNRVLQFADRIQESVGDGGFDYRVGYWGHSAGSMTYAGIWTNLLAGRPPTNDHVRDALNWAQTHWTLAENPGRGSKALYYYYVTLAKALIMARKTTLIVDDASHDWFEELLHELTNGNHPQQPDGHWYNGNTSEWEGDENLVTAYAILALETRTLPPGVPLSMSIILHSSADLHLYDAMGRHTGRNYDTGEIDLQIPGSSYLSDDPQTITISQPEAGSYTVQLIGTNAGDYELEVIGEQKGQMVSSDSYTGTISTGQIQGNFLTVTAMEGALTIFSTPPEILPTMRVQPSSLTSWGALGDVLQDTITVVEMQGEQEVQAISLFASDLVDANGNTIPGGYVSFEPNPFDLAAGGSQAVTVTVSLDPSLPRGLYSGGIIIEAVNVGARRITFNLDIRSRLYLPIVLRDYALGPSPSPPANTPPKVPFNPSPSDGAADQSVNVNLGWSGGDPDPGDTVIYDVYFEASDSTPDELICDGVTSAFCDPGTLSYGARYYWKVIARDSHGATTTEPVWDFTTSSPNNPPNTPSNPSPTDGAADQDINVDLSWTGGDPDPGDNVTYDVYFEANDSTPDVLICNDAPSVFCDPGTLNYETHYYWQVVARDEHGATTTGPVWDFTTSSPPNNPPNIPSNPSPADGAINQSLDVDLSWSGGDPDGDSVTYDVYFEAGDSTPDVLVSDDQSSTSYDPGTLNPGTHYYWQIVATDEHGATTTGLVWEFTTEPATLTLTVPNGGENWHVGTVQNITWSSTGSIANVRLEYSKDEFVSDVHTIAASTPNDGSYSWPVPSDPSITVRVRVSDASDSSINDVSDADWTIFNNSPNDPSDPSPYDGATDQSVDVNLSWTGGDPDGDSVTYDVYFEADDDTPDVLICNDVANTSCDPSTLNHETHYYWQVVARDEHGATSTGPVWDFTTQGVVLVVDAWTADGDWNPKTTFAPGDPIQWVINVENTTSEDAPIELTYDVCGPNGEQVVYWSGTVTTEVGIWAWGLPGAVPTGISGTHTFTGTGLYQGILTQAATTYFVTGPSIGIIETSGYWYPRDRLIGLGYSVSLLPVSAGIDAFRQYDIVYLPVGWADGFSGNYSEIEAHAADYRTYVSEGGGLFVDQPNPLEQPGDSASPTLLPYPITFYNPYDSSDWPPIIVNADHYITSGLSREDMPGPADQITAIDPAYGVLVRGQTTNSPSLAVVEYGQGRIVVQTSHSGEGSFSDEVYRRMIEWVSSDLDSVNSYFHISSGPTPASME